MASRGRRISNLSLTKDFTGQKFGKLTAIESTGYLDKGRSALWRFECECGAIVERSGTKVEVAFTQLGRIPSCGNYECSQHAKTPTARNALISKYRYDARKRDREFLLTVQECEELFQAPCYYCGAPPSKVFPANRGKGEPYIYNGIDRLDNDEGYVVGNVVSCCHECNLAKHTRSADEFLGWVNRVHNYQSR